MSKENRIDWNVLYRNPNKLEQRGHPGRGGAKMNLLHTTSLALFSASIAWMFLDTMHCVASMSFDTAMMSPCGNGVLLLLASGSLLGIWASKRLEEAQK